MPVPRRKLVPTVLDLEAGVPAMPVRVTYLFADASAFTFAEQDGHDDERGDHDNGDDDEPGDGLFVQYETVVGFRRVLILEERGAGFGAVFDRSGVLPGKQKSGMRLRPGLEVVMPARTVWLPFDSASHCEEFFCEDQLLR